MSNVVVYTMPDESVRVVHLPAEASAPVIMDTSALPARDHNRPYWRLRNGTIVVEAPPQKAPDVVA